MRRNRLLRALGALALVLPTAAAHPQEIAPDETAKTDFDAAFADLRQPDATLESADAIPHTQPDGSDDTEIRSIAGGMASYYARSFDGRRTASGERFASSAMTAAHRTLPFGTLVRVTNSNTGKSVVVRVNDRGPFSRDRVLDVSEAAARQLGLIAKGSGHVELAVLSPSA